MSDFMSMKKVENKKKHFVNISMIYTSTLMVMVACKINDWFGWNKKIVVWIPNGVYYGNQKKKNDDDDY